MKTKPNIIFPLKVKPLNDLGHDKYWKAAAGDNTATYGRGRKMKNGGIRLHAGRDLYGKAFKTEIFAICDGVVLDIRDFYDKTDVVNVLHTSDDGRKFIVRYGEVDPGTIKVKKGQEVKQEQVIAYIGQLIETVTDEETGKKTEIKHKNNMLHFEYFEDGGKDNLIKYPLKTNANKFQRRSDVKDPLLILEEGYKNTFGL